MIPSFESVKRCVRDPSFDIKDAGTGHHDNRLTKDPPGQFREPSLRRGYGMAYETPKAFNLQVQLPKVPFQTASPLCQPKATTAATSSKLVKDGPEASGSELDALIDQWNNLYASKFCSQNRNLLEAAGWEKAAEQSRNSCPSDAGQNPQVSHENDSQSEKTTEALDFEGSIWPSVKDELMEFAESRILRWAEDKLRERLQALESLTRPPLLKANSSPESYRVYLRYLMNRTEAAGKNSKAIRNTEAVMSMVLDLLPGLEERLRDQLQDVIDKQDRPGAGIKHDQTDETDRGEANDWPESAHEDSEDADHDIDHKIQAAQEESDHEDGVTTRLEDETEEDEDEDESINDFEEFDEFYADESDDDTYEEPDETNRHYRGSIIDTIEPRTPIVTPRVMRQLHRYEQRYRDTVVTAKKEEETTSAVVRSVDKEEPEVISRKRKAPDSAEHSLAIRSKSMEQRLATISTPTPVGRKRQRLNELQYSPASTACSSELLPSLEDIFSSSIGRASSATTQPAPNSSSPAFRVSKKRKDRNRAQSKVSTELGDTPRGPIATKSEEVTGVSPGLFVTPDVAREANTPLVFKKSVSRRPIPEERFREETAEFQAMTPSAREVMLYTALREMRRRQG
nr:hypothetical protein FVER53263_05828 [Fusarium verticillioides]